MIDGDGGVSHDHSGREPDGYEEDIRDAGGGEILDWLNEAAADNLCDTEKCMNTARHEREGRRYCNRCWNIREGHE
jgi:hypothetical protein